MKIIRYAYLSRVSMLMAVQTGCQRITHPACALESCGDTRTSPSKRGKLPKIKVSGFLLLFSSVFFNSVEEWRSWKKEKKGRYK